MGHETVLTTLTLFGRQKVVDENSKKESVEIETLRFDQEYLFVDNIDEKNADNEAENDKPNLVKDFVIYALLEFEKPVLIAPKSKGQLQLVLHNREVNIMYSLRPYSIHTRHFYTQYCDIVIKRYYNF